MDVQSRGVCSEENSPYTPPTCNICPDRTNRIYKFADLHIFMGAGQTWGNCTTEDLKHYISTVGAITTQTATHALAVVGYSDSGGYWICKNSYGEVNPYWYIPYGTHYVDDWYNVGVTGIILPPHKAIFHCQVNPSGYDTTVWFEYGLTTAYGSSIPYQLTLKGNEWKNVSVILVDPLPSTLYHVRVVAQNINQTVHSQDMTFTSLTY
jgi:C1A family cysteine protease